MPALSSSSKASFAMPYGELELLLAALVEAPLDLVRSRFRKLRIREFPTPLHPGTGNRVQYDLRHVLALTAAFELNNLGIPQGHATYMVEAGWPELCRALLAAARGAEIGGQLANVPRTVGPIFAIGCGSISSKDQLKIDAAALSECDLDALALRPAIIVDTRRVVGALIDWAQSRGQPMVLALDKEIGRLQDDYGWCDCVVQGDEVPAPSNLSKASFLEDGPYFARARELLNTTDTTIIGLPSTRYRLQWLYDYLESPVPVDAPKKYLGLSREQARLHQFINRHAVNLGLLTKERYPLSWTSEDPVVAGLDLLPAEV
jgi:hypothetical protein